MKVLYFDCFSGASGDMILGSLIDAGVDLADVRRALGGLAISEDMVWTERVVRAGISATKFHVRGEEVPTDLPREDDEVLVHSHAHESGASHRHERASLHQDASSRTSAPGARGSDHRTLAEIVELIEGSALSATAKDRAKQLFTVLGEAEAAIHDTPLDRVHLHEVGAIDSIIDIVGTVYALEQLDVARVVSSPLNVGGGMVVSAHGRYPVPAPATMRLLRGAPVYSGKPQVELVTPTGALLVTAYASEFGPIPPMRVDRIGYGAGARDFPGSPNVLRTLIGESDAAAPSQTVIVLEAEIDDMSPQIFGAVMDRLLAEGALDVFYTPIHMKKNRPGTLLSVIASPGLKERLAGLIFRETTTIGLRYREMMRETLDRETVTVTTELGPVRIKVARLKGEPLNAAPEFDDCVRLAADRGVPAKQVHALAMKAYLETTTQRL